MSKTSAVAPLATDVPVRVIRSARRRKTAEARMAQGVLEVRIPQRCSEAEEADFIEHFRGRFERSRQANLVSLDERVADLTRTYDLPMPTDIRWVDNQQRRWGSCTPAEGTIRLSNRLAGFPGWVIDYVIVHELAHLVEFHHNSAFDALMARFPMAERARGYLLAKEDGA